MMSDANEERDAVQSPEGKGWALRNPLVTGVAASEVRPGDARRQLVPAR